MIFSEKNKLRWLLKQRADFIASAIDGMDLDQLRYNIGTITPEEEQSFAELIAKITPYAKATNQEIKYYCLQAGLSQSGTKFDLLVRVIENYKPIEPLLPDPWQQQVIEKEIYPLIISGGPGSAKTTTLARKIVQLIRQGAKVTAVMYNVEAQRSMKKKLKKFLGERLPKQQIYVGTFDELAATRVRVSNSYSDSITEAAGLDWPELRDRYLIIDEAQDLTDERLVLAKKLLSFAGRYIIAGDPRQEVYPGANYFSDLWVSTPDYYKAILYNNYRSGRNIIALCNYFSQKFFGPLHHDQATFTDKPGIIRAVQSPKHQWSDVLYSEIKDMASDSCLIISPVSIEKYGHGEIIEELNISLVHSQKKSIKMLTVGKNLNWEIFNAGTSMKLKGLEANKVIIFGAGYDFANYGSVEDRQFIRLLFVAMSRAREELVFVFDEIKNPYLGAIAEVLTSRPYQPISDIPRARPVKQMTVTEFCRNHDFQVPYEVLDSLPEVDIGACDETTGILMEIYIGACYQLLPDWYRKAFIYRIGTDPVNIGYDDDRRTFNLKPRQSTSLPAWFIANTTDRLQLTKQMFTIKKALDLGIWIPEPELPAQLADISGRLISFCRRFKIKSWGRTIRKNLNCYRSSMIYNTMNGIVDFETEQEVIEIKYSNSSRDPKHLLQCFIYSELTGKPVILVNVRLGEVSLVEYNEDVFPCPGIYEHERITDGIRMAKSLNGFRRVKLPQAVFDKIIVAYDTESVGFLNNDRARLLEIGGCSAYCSGKVIKIISELSPSVKVDDQANFYGLVAGKNLDQDHAVLVRQTRKYLDDIIRRGPYINLRWGTDDLGFVIGSPVPDIHLEQIHTLWCQKNKRARRSDCTLSDVFRELLPELKFHAHHAYEDAYATLLVFFAMVDWT